MEGTGGGKATGPYLLADSHPSDATQTGTSPAFVPSCRLSDIDVARGFGLLGILVSHMWAFFSPVYVGYSDTQWWSSIADRVTMWTLRVLVVGKFYLLFSLLFGAGIALMAGRVTRPATELQTMHQRRMLILLLIGLCHAILLWPGDALTPYAVFGLVLFRIRHFSDRRLLRLATVGMLAPAMIGVMWVLYVAAGSPGRSLAEEVAGVPGALDRASMIYATGTFLQITLERLKEAIYTQIRMALVSPPVFAMMIVGFCAARNGILSCTQANRPLHRKVAFWGLAIGLPANLIAIVAREMSSALNPSSLFIVKAVGLTAGRPALSLFYAVVFLKFAHWLEGSYPVAALAAVGRSSLSNYVLQSAICTTLSYGYGFGWYGRVSPVATVPLAILIFLAQTTLSKYWLDRFRYGPLEWVWRSISYSLREPEYSAVLSRNRQGTQARCRTGALR